MHHHLKCLHSLQQQGETQKYKKNKKKLLKTKYKEINIPEVMKTGSAKLNFLCNFSQLPSV